MALRSKTFVDIRNNKEIVVTWEEGTSCFPLPCPIYKVPVPEWEQPGFRTKEIARIKAEQAEIAVSAWMQNLIDRYSTPVVDKRAQWTRALLELRNGKS